ncbi:MAG TPA: ATP-dependent helicase, partial [Patescibacteria group bacterium]|nr:ATP-dependent helicase [Patescibacteria group bacterium]
MGRFEKEYKRLNDEQKKAVNSIDGPLLVIAGPGTGKTQLLTTRVANILRISDAQPQNILCLTFTESAAYEMRERLIGIVGQQAYNITISTYHAFGRELIGRFPDYFSDMPDMHAIDDLGIHSTIQDIVAALPYSNALKKSDYYLRDVISSISDFKRSLFEPDDIRKVARLNLAFIEKTSMQTKKHLHAVARIDKKSIPAFSALLKATKQPAGKQFAIPGVISLDYLWQEQLAEAVQTAEKSGKTTSITAWKNAWLARDAAGEFIARGKDICQKLLALADIYESYLQALNTQGLFDYDDMILRAIDGLENNTELRYTLQEQYMYILLDEFQDTNAAQLKLVKLLTDNPAYEGKPNILAVGDDDQAIYAFQGADYSHMLAFKNMYKDVKTISLTKNYRSHKDVLHVAHGIAQQIETRLHHHLKEIDKLLSAESQELPATSQVARHEFKSDVAQYGWVSEHIAKLIKDGVNPSQIAVLAPQHRYLEPIVPYLRQLKIPVRYDKREDVLEDVHIAQLLHMAELVLSLANNNSATANNLWPQILSYEFWQLPTEHIWKLSWKASEERSNWTELLMSDTATHHIALFFAQLAPMVSIETLETMLDYLVGVNELPIKAKKAGLRSPYYEYNFGKRIRQQSVSSFWALLSNLTVLRQHLREHKNQDKSQLMLLDMIEFSRAHRDADIKVLNTS